MKPSIDRSIAEMLKRNDEKGLEKLFHSHQDLLFRYIYHFTKNEYTTQELIQDVFLRVWNYRSKIDPDKSLTDLLYRIAKNICLNYIRDTRNLELAMENYSIHLNTVHRADTHDPLVFKESARRIERAIENLPDQCKTIFKLSREEGMSYEAISEEKKLSKNTVRNQMVSALKRIRIELSEYSDAVVSLFLFLIIRFL